MSNNPAIRGFVNVHNAERFRAADCNPALKGVLLILPKIPNDIPLGQI